MVCGLSDHLGNVRAAFHETTANNLALRSYADYYPFGWRMPGRQKNPGSYRFAYQGQERDGELGTNWEAFELRLWDGRLGRWFAPDPYGQYHSPYLGMGNDPVGRFDPDGGADVPCGWSGSSYGSYVAGNAGIATREAMRGVAGGGNGNQTQSKNDKKGFLGFMDKLFEAAEAEEEMNHKYFKTHYAGKPTKRYLRLLRKIEKEEVIVPAEVRALLRL